MTKCNPRVDFRMEGIKIKTGEKKERKNEDHARNE